MPAWRVPRIHRKPAFFGAAPAEKAMASLVVEEWYLGGSVRRTG